MSQLENEQPEEQYVSEYNKDACRGPGFTGPACHTILQNQRRSPRKHRVSLYFSWGSSEYTGARQSRHREIEGIGWRPNMETAEPGLSGWELLENKVVPSGGVRVSQAYVRERNIESGSTTQYGAFNVRGAGSVQ